jgi:hypothetical protein
MQTLIKDLLYGNQQMQFENEAEVETEVQQKKSQMIAKLMSFSKNSHDNA